MTLVNYGNGYCRMFDMLPAGTVISLTWVIVMMAPLLVIGPVIGIL